MQLRAIVLAGVTSQASSSGCVTSGCASPDARQAERRRPAPVVARAERPRPVAPAPCAPRSPHDPALVAAADRLADAMLAWQPLVRNRRGGEAFVRELAGIDVAVVEAKRCAERPLLSLEKDPFLLAAIQFHESSWRPGVVGGRGELGLMQVHGVALQGLRRDAALDPATNVRLGYEYLLRCRRICGPGQNRLFLGAFASGACDARIPAARDFLEAVRAMRARARAA
jgi:hypothetical protein